MIIFKNPTEHTSETFQFFYGSLEPYSYIQEYEVVKNLRAVIENIVDDYLFEFKSVEILLKIKTRLKDYLAQCVEVNYFEINSNDSGIIIYLRLKNKTKFDIISCVFR